MTHDYLISLIRTAAPRLPARCSPGWPRRRASSSTSSTALTAGVVALAMAGYYALVRVAEAGWSGSVLPRRDPTNSG